MDLGWNPKSPLDLLDSVSETNVQSVEDHILLLWKIFKDVQESYAGARELQSNRLSSKFTPPAYEIGDYVMVSTRAFRDYYSRKRPSKKLQSKRIGHFLILELIGKNAVRLELPATMRVHPVINVSHTSMFFQQPEDISRARVPPLLQYLNTTTMHTMISTAYWITDCMDMVINSSYSGKDIPLTRHHGNQHPVFLINTATFTKHYKIIFQTNL